MSVTKDYWTMWFHSVDDNNWGIDNLSIPFL